MCTSFLSRQAWYIARTSAASRPSGFSHITCLPCFAAARAIGLCLEFRVAMITASTRSFPRIDSVIGTDRFEIRGDVVATPVLAALLQKVLAGITNAAQSGPRIEADGRHVVVIADGPGTDDGDANGVGGRKRH